MPEALIPLFFFFFVLMMTKMILSYKRENRQAATPQPVDNSLRLSELRAMIHEAVHEATADLGARVEALERDREADVSEPAKLPLGRPGEALETEPNGAEGAAVPARRSRA